jgi:hypothetical protein
MNFLGMLDQKAREMRDVRKSKVRGELNGSGDHHPYGLMTAKTMGSQWVNMPLAGVWQQRSIEEKQECDLYAAGKHTTANNLYADKNSHAGTEGNTYIPKLI